MSFVVMNHVTDDDHRYHYDIILIITIIILPKGEEGSPGRVAMCCYWKPKARDPLVQRGQHADDDNDHHNDDD